LRHTPAVTFSHLPGAVPREVAARVIVCAHAQLEAAHVLVQQVERHRTPRAGGLGDTPGVRAGATTEHPP